jgi:hypothetical protein
VQEFLEGCEGHGKSSGGIETSRNHQGMARRIFFHGVFKQASQVCEQVNEFHGEEHLVVSQISSRRMDGWNSPR